MAVGEASVQGSETGHKTPSKRMRARRAQYANQACNECKRRKVKCNGVQPCYRCASLSVSCLYEKLHAEYPNKQSKVTSHTMTSENRAPAESRPEVSHTFTVPAVSRDARQSASHQESPPQLNNAASLALEAQMKMAPGSSKATPDSPQFCGPSSSEHTLNVVSGNLRALGIPSAILNKADSGAEYQSHLISSLAHRNPLMKLLATDPLWEWTKADAINLINGWCHGVGSLYPIVGAAYLLETADKTFACLELAQRDGLKASTALAAEALFNDGTNHLKAVLAIGRLLESGGRNDQAQRLFQSISEAVEGTIWTSGGIESIRLLVLVAMYHYHLDDEVRTGRLMGFAARLCLEMGLHRQEMVEKLFTTIEERDTARRVFWSVYMFERRTSLGQGIPFIIQDSYVDPSLFSLDTSDSILSAMLEWTKLAGEAWQVLNSPAEKGVEIKQDNLEYLDYRINQWFDQLPDHLTLDRSSLPNPLLRRANIYHQAVFFIRKSHLRNLIHRPALLTSARINSKERCALQAIGIARESIQTLSELHTHTTLVATHALFFKHLLLTVFGNLLLAVVNAPSKFWNTVNVEFDMALDLIKFLSTRSAPLMLLWRRLEGLQELQTKLFQDPSLQTAQEQGSGHLTSTEARRLRFEELFPPFPTEPVCEQETYSPAFGMRSSEMREQVNSLFDAIVGPDAFFDFSEDWGPPVPSL